MQLELEAHCFTSLLGSLASRGDDELAHIFSFLSPAERAASRLISHAIGDAASADQVWAPLLVQRGFTAEGLRAWAPRSALELYSRVH